VQRIDIINKREWLKKIIEDSRLNDSRKYLLNKETPNFALKEEP
jgi:hypothetical protein